VVWKFVLALLSTQYCFGSHHLEDHDGASLATLSLYGRPLSHSTLQDGRLWNQNLWQSGVSNGNGNNKPADKTGLPWRGDTKDMAIQTGTRALQCAANIMEHYNNNNKSPQALCFFSDSNDLV
jgi:hypothetical protein